MSAIDLRDVISDSDNSRESAPGLQGLGYGIVEPANGKPSLFALALGTPEQKAEYCKLVERHEEGLVALALSMAQQGQLQNCRVRPAGEGKYCLTFGCRRALASLYLHAKSAGKRPPVIRATVGDGDEKAGMKESAGENAHRLPPSFIDQARLFQRMRADGMTTAEIAEIHPLGKDPAQVIRLRLRLLKCTEDVQLKVHAGKMTQEAALATLSARSPAGEKPPVAKRQRGHSGEQDAHATARPKAWPVGEEAPSSAPAGTDGMRPGQNRADADANGPAGQGDASARTPKPTVAPSEGGNKQEDATSDRTDPDAVTAEAQHGNAADRGSAGAEYTPREKGEELRSLLEDFCRRIKALDLEDLETDDPDGLSRLAFESYRVVKAVMVRARAMNGTLDR